MHRQQPAGGVVEGRPRALAIWQPLPCRAGSQEAHLAPMKRSPVRIALLGVALSTFGCRHRALIASDPPGAQVRIGRQYIGVTPVEVRVSRMPWSDNTVRVNLPGRRWMEVEVNRWKRKSSHEVLLVRQHGRAGTWTPEDAEQ